MRNLSKSKIIAFRQCAKRLWLEVHRPDLKQETASTEAGYRVGHEVGAVARRIYDPEGRGALVDAQKEGFAPALKRSTELLAGDVPIFEAGFAAAGGLAFADVMLPTGPGGRRGWRMVEVKASTMVKDYHRDDAAVQAFIAREAGVPLEAIAVATIDNSWVYQGGDDYRGLLREEDLTEETRARSAEVRGWIGEAQKVAAASIEPAITTGGHCSEPFACGFLAYCQAAEPQPEMPVAWLPRLQQRAVKDFIETKSVVDLRDVPDEMLSPLQQRVKAHTVSGKPYFDAAAARRLLAAHPLPAMFLDFETVQPAVPRWAGTHAYQQVPFQFSLHRLSADGRLEHKGFLDLTGDDPAPAFAAALVRDAEGLGPVFVYNAAFERTRMLELADTYPRLSRPLHAIVDRLVDLLPITRDTFYHPSQHGSWSIKSVLPAVAPDLDYDKLDGVKNGGMASAAYLGAVDPATPAARKAAIEHELTEYCRLDTYAMVRLWQKLAGREDLKL